MTPQIELQKRLAAQVRSDFDRLRWERQPIHAQILHRATNAEAEGVLGQPVVDGEMVAFQGAGHREGGIRHDEHGNICYRDDPILDVQGKPIVEADGRPIDIQMPAFRSLIFTGNPSDFNLLSETAERAGRILSQSNTPIISELLEGWSFSTPSDLWWAFVFELAWSRRQPLLIADKRLWLPNEPNKFIPYDLQAAQRLAESGGLGQVFSIPTQWLRRLPEAWVSEIKNIVLASVDAIDFLLSEFPTANSSRESESKLDATDEADAGVSSMHVQIKRRFAIALSFPGERREFVANVATGLKSSFGEDRIFYDKFHESELARPNLDLVLQRFYADESDLVVVFVCGEYSEKEWCGLEWRAIRDLMKSKSRTDEEVMFLRFDNKPLEGLRSIDGFVDISTKNERDVVDAIVRRWTATR